MKYSLRHIATHRLTLSIVIFVALLLIIWTTAVSAQPRETDGLEAPLAAFNLRDLASSCAAVEAGNATSVVRAAGRISRGS